MFCWAVWPSPPLCQGYSNQTSPKKHQISGLQKSGRTSLTKYCNVFVGKFRGGWDSVTMWILKRKMVPLSSLFTIRIKEQKNNFSIIYFNFISLCKYMVLVVCAENTFSLSLNYTWEALHLILDHPCNPHSVTASGPTSLDNAPHYTTHPDLTTDGEDCKQAWDSWLSKERNLDYWQGETAD